MSREWRTVTKATPCPACGKPDWCAWTREGWLKCERTADSPTGFLRVSVKDGGGIFKPKGVSARDGTKEPSRRPSRVGVDWAKEAAIFAVALTPEDRTALAVDLGVSDAALAALDVGWASKAELRRLRASGEGWRDHYPGGAFTFPERNAAGRAVGLSLRTLDGRKGFPAGASRGLIVPTTLKETPDPVLVVEGASDVAALLTLGLAAVGRPSNAGGARILSSLLEGRTVLVVGERDQKGDGTWPGRDGARNVAEQVAAEWNGRVAWTLPPEGHKDVRAWLCHRVKAGLDLSDAAACGAAGVELLALLMAGANSAKPKCEPIDGEDSPEPFPANGFPPSLGPLRDYFEAVAEATQTPREAVALLGLAIATTGALRKVEVECGGWREPAPLWALTLMPSGERKSALLTELTRPLAEWERDEAERLAPEIARSASQGKILEAQLKRLEDAAAKSGTAADVAAAGDAAERLAAMREVFAPRLCITEATPEALAVTMARNGERALVAAAEGDAVDVILGRYSERGKPSLGVFLAGHAGDALTQLRIGRESVPMQRPALALALIVQPEAVYDCYTSRAARGRGLLARFLACAPKSRLGARAIRPAPVSEGLREHAWTAPVRRMLNWPMPHDLTDSDGEPTIARFDPEGQALFDRFRADLEPRLCPRTGDLGASDAVRAWASKLPGALARLCLAMECLAAAMKGHTAPPATIIAATVQAALAWATWLIDAQQRAEAAALAWGDEGAGEAGGLTPEQRRLVELIRRKRGTMSGRELWHAQRKRYGSVAEAEAELQALVNAGIGDWEHPPPAGGRPPARRLVLRVCNGTTNNGSTPRDTGSALSLSVVPFPDPRPGATPIAPVSEARPTDTGDTWADGTPIVVPSDLEAAPEAGNGWVEV